MALNSVVPANLGTLAMLLMFNTIIIGTTFAGVLAGMAVQKIFYTIVGAGVYLFLFLGIDGSFDLQLGFISAHPAATIILVVAVFVLLYLVARVLETRIKQWWSQAKVGAAILIQPRAYVWRVLVPEAVSYLAMLAIIAVFLSAYSIPVSLHTILRVVAGNSIANSTSVTPGGAGVVQGFNVLSLKGITSTANATAYSVAQQLVVTVWGLVLAIGLLVRAFGWSGGRTLVTESYGEARTKASEQKAARRAKRQDRLTRRHEPEPEPVADSESGP